MLGTFIDPYQSARKPWLLEKTSRQLDDPAATQLLRISIMRVKRNKGQIVISAFATMLIVAHLLFPAVRVDGFTLVLFAIAVLPWLGTIFKSVQLPGGFRIEYHDLEKAKENAERAGLLEVPTDKKMEPPFVSRASEDPNLALAGLHIEIEKRLQKIGQKYGLNPQQGVMRLLRHLSNEGAICEREVSVISDLIGLLNEAVHRATVDARATQ
ncbi:MAG: hypothetical protein HY644_03420 [Acidobacteria bacterium]|nr:hypothetical protein [Acidobacteriota bacterium]